MSFFPMTLKEIVEAGVGTDTAPLILEIASESSFLKPALPLKRKEPDGPSPIPSPKGKPGSMSHFTSYILGIRNAAPNSTGSSPASTHLPLCSLSSPKAMEDETSENVPPLEAFSVDDEKFYLNLSITSNDVKKALALKIREICEPL